MNELAKLPQSLALDTIMTYLKATTVQVIENRLGDTRLFLPYLPIAAVISIALTRSKSTLGIESPPESATGRSLPLSGAR
jgi:hypothetical protein